MSSYIQGSKNMSLEFGELAAGQNELVSWHFVKGNSPLVATAIHDGHDLREEVAELIALDNSERLREEDPFTGIWTSVAKTRLVAQRSRFEMDLNRPREKAVYLTPEDSWGLHVWKEKPPAKVIERSLAQYDAFYAHLRDLFSDLERRFGRFVVFDIHSYNHRRSGANSPAENPLENPEVNVGTGTMNRQLWAPIVERFMEDMRSFDFLGRKLDVRENVKFKGGNMARWTHENFPETGCVLALEFKKFWMDEWTGELDKAHIEAIQQALGSTVSGVLEELKKL
jgi:N-formylglutamate amidohydrolase